MRDRRSLSPMRLLSARASARAGLVSSAAATALDPRERVRLALEPDHVGVWPGRRADAAGTPASSGEDSVDTVVDDAPGGAEVMATALRGERLTRTFVSTAGNVHACVDIDIEVSEGELVVVRGPSGAGKTTLLNLLGGLDRPTAGRVWIGDVEATALDEDALARLRRERLGFVFQSCAASVGRRIDATSDRKTLAGPTSARLSDRA